MSHRTVITSLTQGQSAWVSGLGSQSFGNMYQLASFKGFLYSPPQGVKVVWWVFRTAAGSAEPSVDMTIINVLINIGNAWSSPKATIPASAPGIYYIVYGGVTVPNSEFNIYLYLSGKVVSTALVSPNGATSIYRECAHMAPLASGTTVSIRAHTGSFSPGTGILGFLLYPK
jgi:hypothetical protein